MENAIACPKCMILLTPKLEGDNVIVQCSNCGYKKDFKQWVEHTCSKCGFDKCIIVYHAKIKGDEDTLTIYKCIKCGATEREW